MAQVDKTDSAVGVVRALIATDFDSEDFDTVIPVGLDASGHCVKGAGQTGVIGVVIPGRTVHRAGQVADIFKLADIVECADLSAGTKYYATAAGALTADLDDGEDPVVETYTYVGFTVEADRLILAGF